MTAASARAARDEVLAYLDDPSAWRGELEVWSARCCTPGEPSTTLTPTRASRRGGTWVSGACSATSSASGTTTADTAYFEVGGESREAVQSDDVVLPIVERADLSWTESGAVRDVRDSARGLLDYLRDAPVRDAFFPAYPSCPDCGGRLEWAEAAGVPGSRRCAGATEPDMPAAGMSASPGGVTSDREAGCGSRYVDTRFGVAGPVPGCGS